MASVESGKVGAKERPHTLDSAWTARSRTPPLAGRRNASPLPKGRGMSKQDPQRWLNSPRASREGHSQQCSSAADTTSMWPSAPKHTTTAPAFPMPRISPIRARVAEDLFISDYPSPWSCSHELIDAGQMQEVAPFSSEPVHQLFHHMVRPPDRDRLPQLVGLFEIHFKQLAPQPFDRFRVGRRHVHLLVQAEAEMIEIG